MFIKLVVTSEVSTTKRLLFSIIENKSNNPGYWQYLWDRADITPCALYSSGL